MISMARAKELEALGKIDGGFTVSTHGELTPDEYSRGSQGFLVGGVVRERIVTSRETLWSAIKCFAWEYERELSEDTFYLGCWRNTDTGAFHLDVTEWFPTLISAIREGKNRAEVAIWDVEDCAEIRL